VIAFGQGRQSPERTVASDLKMTKRNEDHTMTVNPDTGEISEDQAVNLIGEAFKMAGVQLAAADDPLGVQQQIVTRVMQAQSLDELFGNWEVTTSDKLEGRTFTILGAEFSIFNSEQGPIPLARVASVEGKDKTSVSWVTTAPNLTSFIARAMQLDALPFTAKIVGNKTSRGFISLHFERG
jgi:hypothetical protein